jgi:copper chaperone CopZ
MTGPATNAATISTVWRTMGRRTAGLYLGTVAGASILAGLLLDVVISGASESAMHASHWMMPGEVKTAAAVVLLAVLLAAFVRPSTIGDVRVTTERSNRMKIRIQGMSCDHCARSIQRALMESAGVESAVVDYRKGIAVVTGSGFDRDVLKGAVESLGYKVLGFEEPPD